jgi:hypothetical protein
MYFFEKWKELQSEDGEIIQLFEGVKLHLTLLSFDDNLLFLPRQGHPLQIVAENLDFFHLLVATESASK